MTGRSLRLAALVAAVSMALVPVVPSGSGASSRTPIRDADKALAGALASFAVGDPDHGSRVPAMKAKGALGAAALGERATGRTEPSLLVKIPTDTAMTARPGGGRTVGILPAGSRFYGTPTVAWIQEVSDDGKFGRLAVPYNRGSRSGWIRIQGLKRSTTTIRIETDLSERRLSVERRGRTLLRTRMAIGSRESPTPPGRYFVTDRVPFPNGGPLGSFAFGISGIQPDPPAGWTGGDQLAIHGTNDLSSIGRRASAGCLRVSEATIDRLRPLLRLGTPVVIAP